MGLKTIKKWILKALRKVDQSRVANTELLII
jgi:hypothetical protein